MTGRLSSNKRTPSILAIVTFALVVLFLLAEPTPSRAAPEDTEGLLPLPLCLPLPIPILGCPEHHHTSTPPPPPTTTTTVPPPPPPTTTATAPPTTTTTVVP